MNKEITIIRVDPIRKKIARIPFRAGGNATTVREVKRVLGRPDSVSWRRIREMGQVALVVAGGNGVDEAVPRWRLRGGEETAGVGMLFGQGPAGGMTNVPVDVAWVEKNIVWLEGESAEQLDARAIEVFATLPDEIRVALTRAIDSGPLTDADTTWAMSQEDQSLSGALITLGLTTPVSAGRGLTRLGERVRELATGELR